MGPLDLPSLAALLANGRSDDMACLDIIGKQAMGITSDPNSFSDDFSTRGLGLYLASLTAKSSFQMRDRTKLNTTLSTNLKRLRLSISADPCASR